MAQSRAHTSTKVQHSLYETTFKFTRSGFFIWIWTKLHKLIEHVGIDPLIRIYTHIERVHYFTRWHVFASACWQTERNKHRWTHDLLCRVTLTWAPECAPPPPLINRVRWFLFEEGAVFSAAPPPPLHRARATWRGEAASPLSSSSSLSLVSLPMVQWAPCGPTPSLLGAAVYLLHVSSYSRRERERGENNNLQELVIPVCHLPRAAARRGAASAPGMCCYNQPVPRVLWMLMHMSPPPRSPEE